MNATQIVSAVAVFAEQYSKTKAVPFNPKWKNTTGYFDGAVHGEHALLLKSGEVVCSEDEKGRKIVIIGTVLGNIVVFERYSNRKDIITTNMSNTMHNYTKGRFTTVLAAADLDNLFGVKVNNSLELWNIGTRLERFHEMEEFITEYKQEKEYI